MRETRQKHSRTASLTAGPSIPEPHAFKETQSWPPALEPSPDLEGPQGLLEDLFVFLILDLV